jgi:hypothetical protein
MSVWNLPAGVTQSQIDGPADPRDSHCDDELWNVCSDKQQDRIRAAFLDKQGLDLVVEVEDGTIDPRKLRGIWLAFRDSEVEHLLFNGHLRLPSEWFEARP